MEFLFPGLSSKILEETVDKKSSFFFFLLQTRVVLFFIYYIFYICIFLSLYFECLRFSNIFRYCHSIDFRIYIIHNEIRRVL